MRVSNLGQPHRHDCRGRDVASGTAPAGPTASARSGTRYRRLRPWPARPLYVRASAYVQSHRQETKAREATRAVIKTGRSRPRTPSRTASSRVALLTQSADKGNHDQAIEYCRARERNETTPAEVDSGIPRRAKAITPPVNAKGKPLSTMAASLAEPKTMNSRAKISANVTGTTTAKRWLAEIAARRCRHNRSSTPLEAVHPDRCGYADRQRILQNHAHARWRVITSELSAPSCRRCAGPSEDPLRKESSKSATYAPVVQNLCLP